MRRLYASKLTKEDLIQNGITEITKDAKIFKGDKEIFPFWLPGKRPYLGICIYERDEDGHLIKGKDCVYKYKRVDGTIGESISWQAKIRTLGLHRIMWAWHYGEVPEGMVVDHIDNKHETLYDYRLENLQLLTPAENLAKEKDLNTRELKCKMNKPRSFYEDKLLKYEKEYEEAKSIHDAKLAHKLRGNISNIRARLRYWDSHKEEYGQNLINKETEMEEYKNWKNTIKEKKLLKEWKDIFRRAGNKDMWRQMIKVEKNWNTYDDLQKEHIWKLLEKTFGEEKWERIFQIDQ